MRAVRAGQAADLDDRAGVRRVDEAAAAEVDADVASAIEEHEVAGAQSASSDVRPRRPLLVGDAGKRHADAAVHVLDQPGAVEAGEPLTAPHTRAAEVAPGKRRRARAGCRAGRGAPAVALGA